MPSPTAVNVQIANVGSVRNSGVELELTGAIVENQKFGWQSTLNFSRNVNKVLNLSNEHYKGDNILSAPIQGTVSGGYAQLILPGYPQGTFYGKEFYGIKDGKELLSEEDKILGSAQPKFIYGLTNAFTHGQFSLSFLLRGTVGNKIYNLTGNNLGYLNNLPGKNVLKVATTAGLDRDQPKVYSSRWIENGSFMRLDNLSLGYTFGDLKSTFFNGARIYLAAQNLFVITGYSGLDPEVNSEISGTGVAPLGVDYLSYPRSGSISIGFSTTF